MRGKANDAEALCRGVGARAYRCTISLGRKRERERERANMHELITRVLCGGIIDSSVAASLIYHHRESLLLHQDADYHQTSQ
jgi:hypothetical protein